jgi:glycosyltransferase involved in cell wall biosynthesis
VRVIFDHTTWAAAANHYRRGAIARWLGAGDSVVLCTYNLATLDYRFHVFAAGFADREFSASSFLALETLLQEAPVAELFREQSRRLRRARALSPIGSRACAGAMRASASPSRRTDYLAVCPSFRAAECRRRLLRHPGYRGRASAASSGIRHRTSRSRRLRAWRRGARPGAAAIAAADEVRCFSESSRELLARAYPSLARDVLTVVPHRVEFSPRPPALHHGGPLRIGVIGQINAQKGAHIVAQLVRRLDRERSDARVVVLGSLEIPLRSPRLEVTGRYSREDLPRLVESHAINMMLFPSIWPETFSYVVAEMMAMRLPIVAFDLGAPAERLRGYPLARLVAKVDADAVLDAMPISIAASPPKPRPHDRASACTSSPARR